MHKAILPLSPTKWDQTYPYNKLCPIIGPYQSPTGCAATVLAQLMYYHQWPQTETATIPGYDSGSGYNKVSLDELPPITFDWGNMLLKYEYDAYTGNPLYTDEQADAVALLMQYAGHAVKMNYGTDASGSDMANLAPALTNYFNYDSRTTRLLSRAQYSNADWEEKVYNELAAGNPVIYDGFTDAYGHGHVFLCDGYDGDGFFHINWGWRGNCDGYYRLSVLNPGDTSGAGASSSAYGYTWEQQAVFGAMPASNEPREDLHALSNDSYKYDEYGQLTLQMKCLDKREVSLSYEMGIGYYDGDGNLQVIASQNAGELSYGYYTGVLYFDGWNDLPQGSYVLHPMSRVAGSSHWEVLTAPDMAIYADVDAEHTPTLRYYSQLGNELTVTGAQLDGSLYRGADHTLTVTIKNDGEEYFGIISLYGKYELQEEYSELTSTMVTIPAHSEENVTLFFKPNGTGNLSLCITNGTYYSTFTDYLLSGESTLNVTISAQSGDITGDMTKLKATSIVVDNMSVENGENIVLSNGTITGKMTIKNEGEEAFSGQVQISCFVPMHEEWYNEEDNVLEVNEYVYPAGQLDPTLTLASGEETTVDFSFEMQSPSNWWHSVDGTVPESIYHRIGLFMDYGYDEQTETQYLIFNGEQTVYPYYAVTITNSDGTTQLASYKEEIEVPSTAAYVDLRGFSGNGIVLNTTSAQPNCLYLRLAEDQAITGLPTTNVIVGSTAEQIVLTDGYDFLPPFEFTVRHISYTRTNTQGSNGTGGWQTLVLPFACSKLVRTDNGTQIDWFHQSSDTGKNLWIKDFVSVDGSTVLFGFAGEQLEAYHPYIIAVPGDKWGSKWDLRNVGLRFEGENANIQADSRCNISTSSWKMKGTLAQTAQTDVYALNEGGTAFELLNATTIRPYSAWFVSKNSYAPARLNIGNAKEESVNAIETIYKQTDTDRIFNLQGQPMGNNMESLPRGLYIYQGKKVIK